MIKKYWPKYKASPEHPQRLPSLAWISPIADDDQPMRLKNRYLFYELELYPGEIYREAQNRTTKAITHKDKTYFVKLHYPINTGKAVKTGIKELLRRRLPIFSASNEWRAILHCDQHNILTTPLVAYGKWGKWHKQWSFTVTKELANMCSLGDIAQAWQKKPPSLALKRQLIYHLAKLARDFHEHGMNHCDFYLCHFLTPNTILTANTPVTDLPIYIIDLHRVQIHKKVSRHALIKDLSTLLVSTLPYQFNLHDYFFFLKHYKKCSLRETLADRKLWRRIVKRAVNMHHRSRGKRPDLPWLYRM